MKLFTKNHGQYSQYFKILTLFQPNTQNIHTSIQNIPFSVVDCRSGGVRWQRETSGCLERWTGRSWFLTHEHGSVRDCLYLNLMMLMHQLSYGVAYQHLLTSFSIDDKDWLWWESGPQILYKSAQQKWLCGQDRVDWGDGRHVGHKEWLFSVNCIGSTTYSERRPKLAL